MLSIQKSRTDKTGLGYVASTSDIPSTSKTVFVKPTIPEPPTTCMDKGKEVIGGDVPATAKATQKPPTIRRPPISDPIAHFSKLRDRRSIRSCQAKLHPALDLWPGIRIHDIRIHHIWIHGIRLLSISSNSGDLFQPIRMARQTNKGTT